MQPLAVQLCVGALLSQVNCRFIGRPCGRSPPPVCLRRSPSFHFTFRRSLFAVVFFRSDFPSLFLLSNSIHERGHTPSFCLLISLSALHFLHTFLHHEGGRGGERRSREGEMDRLGDGDKRSISRPNSPGRCPPPPLAPLLQAPPPSSVPVTFVPCRLTRVH